jgi:hypothetical protein
VDYLLQDAQEPTADLPVMDQALETAGLMLGTDKSRGYCLEMMCADFFGRSKFGRNESRSLGVRVSSHP